MKKIIIFLLIVAAAYYFLQRYHKAHDVDLDPEVIVNPVYAEARVKFETPGRTVDGVMLMQTVDQADCQKQSHALERYLKESQASICPTCKLQPSECKTELEPRYLKLFDNKTSSVTYLSLPRGDRSERELRLIYWGVTLEESDRLCSALPAFQKGRKGVVTCVRAPRE